jgi:hypothetical protein
MLTVVGNDPVERSKQRRQSCVVERSTSSSNKCKTTRRPGPLAGTLLGIYLDKQKGMKQKEKRNGKSQSRWRPGVNKVGSIIQRQGEAGSPCVICMPWVGMYVGDGGCRSCIHSFDFQSIRAGWAVQLDQTRLHVEVFDCNHIHVHVLMNLCTVDSDTTQPNRQTTGTLVLGRCP